MVSKSFTMLEEDILNGNVIEDKISYEIDDVTKVSFYERGQV